MKYGLIFVSSEPQTPLGLDTILFLDTYLGPWTIHQKRRGN